ncbi:unnamed protein product [Symbiodinium sp. CCMP2456]|nr:unnamed protein product [Symbiodinium sp. CCMP2456]
MADHPCQPCQHAASLRNEAQEPWVALAKAWSGLAWKLRLPVALRCFLAGLTNQTVVLRACQLPKNRKVHRRLKHVLSVAAPCPRDRRSQGTFRVVEGGAAGDTCLVQTTLGGLAHNTEATVRGRQSVKRALHLQAQSFLSKQLHECKPPGRQGLL